MPSGTMSSALLPISERRLTAVTHFVGRSLLLPGRLRRLHL